MLCACLEYRFFVSCKFQANSSYSGVFEPSSIIVRSKAETPNQEELYESIAFIEGVSLLYVLFDYYKQLCNSNSIFCFACLVYSAFR